MDQETAIHLLCRILNEKTPPRSLSSSLKLLDQSDWAELLDCAKQRGMLLLLGNRLHELRQEKAIPDSIQDYFHQIKMAAIARNVRMQRELGIVFNALRTRKIDVIALKGIYLVEAVYANLGWRTFYDVDLLVRKGDLAQAVTTLKSLGYQMTSYFDLKNDHPGSLPLPPMHKPGGAFIELHWGLIEENDPFRIDVSGIWQRALPAKIAGVNVMALCLEDLLLHLCIHFTYQHRMKAGLGSLYDIAEVLKKNKAGIDWQKLIAIAKEWGVERVIWITLFFVNQLFGVGIAQSTLDELYTEKIEPQIVEKARAQLLACESGDIIYTPDLIKLIETRNIGIKASILLHRIFLPKQTLASIHNISPSSCKIYIYYLVRFLGLLRGYAKTVRQLLNGNKQALKVFESEKNNEEIQHWLAKLGN